MKKAKKLLAVLLVLCLCLTTFAACGQSSSSSSAQQATGSSTVNTDGDKKPVTLRFMWWGGDSRHEATLAALDLYMERNPHVTIESEFQGFDGYEEKLATQIAGGTAPDIMQLTSFRMVEFAGKNNIFVDLNEYKDILDMSGFEQSFLDNFCVVDGRLTGLPTGLNAHNIVLNTQVTDAAGVNLEGDYTWDDFITEGAKVHAANPDQYFAWYDGDGWYLLLRSMIRQETGKWIIDDDYTIGATRDSLIHAYEFIQRCYEEGVCEPTETGFQYTGKSHENPLWINGNMGSLYMNSSSFGQFRFEKTTLKPVLIPQMENAKENGIIVQPSQVFSVKTGENEEEAVKVLNFLYNDEDAIALLKSERGTPANSNARDYLAENGLLDADVSEAVNINLAKGCAPVNQITEETLIKEVIMDISEEVSLFQLTPEEAADKTLENLEATLQDMGLV